MSAEPHRLPRPGWGVRVVGRTATDTRRTNRGLVGVERVAMFVARVAASTWKVAVRLEGRSQRSLGWETWRILRANRDVALAEGA